eukprot:6191117-Pleurochrysis_carterae.AAC.1
MFNAIFRGLVPARQALIPPPAEEIQAVRKYTRKRGLSLVYTSVYRHNLDSAIFKAVRPPRNNELGTKLRCISPMPTLLSIFEERTSAKRGLPITSAVKGIRRSFVLGASESLLFNRPVMPTRETKVRHTYKLK